MGKTTFAAIPVMTLVQEENRVLAMAWTKEGANNLMNLRLLDVSFPGTTHSPVNEEFNKGHSHATASKAAWKRSALGVAADSLRVLPFAAAPAHPIKRGESREERGHDLEN
jgi:hypothetical protein